MVWMALAVTAALASCKFPGATMSQPTQCSGGAELIGNACFCANGMIWNGLTCQGTPDPSGCSGGSYLFGPAGSASCHCMLGSTVNNGECVALQCTGGAVAGDTECVCPNGTQWDGAQCAAPQLQCNGGAVASGDQCVCPEGTAWDGSQCAAAQAQPTVTCTGGAVASGDQCVCPDATAWDGTSCVASVAPAPAPRRTCKSVMAEKNYEPGQWRLCNGVNERCAIALLDKNYEPGRLPLCRGVDGACAETLLAKNYEPGQLVNCKRH